MTPRLRDFSGFAVGAMAFTLLAVAGDPAVTALKHTQATDCSLYSQPPVKRFVSFGLRGWEHVSPKQIVVWNGVNEAYLPALGAYARHCALDFERLKADRTAAANLRAQG